MTTRTYTRTITVEYTLSDEPAPPGTTAYCELVAEDDADVIAREREQLLSDWFKSTEVTVIDDRIERLAVSSGARGQHGDQGPGWDGRPGSAAGRPANT